MRNEFTAIVERDGPWYVAYCADVPVANGQGKPRDECLA
jgi:predicted RNase H-like HicB family nuclease